MAAQNSPFVEATYGWPYGSSGWDGDMNTNLVKFSYLHDSNIDAIVSSLPAIVNGKAYFNTADNRLYFDANGQRYSSVTPKWFEVTLRTTGQVYQFDGITLNLGSVFEKEASPGIALGHVTTSSAGIVSADYTVDQSAALQALLNANASVLIDTQIALNSTVVVSTDRAQVSCSPSGKLLAGPGMAQSVMLRITGHNVILDKMNMDNPALLKANTGGRQTAIEIRADHCTVMNSTFLHMLHAITTFSDGEWYMPSYINNLADQCIGTGAGALDDGSTGFGEDRGDAFTIWGATGLMAFNRAICMDGQDARIAFHCESLGSGLHTRPPNLKRDSFDYHMIGNYAFGNFRRHFAFEAVNRGLMSGNVSGGGATWWPIALTGGTDCLADNNIVLYDRTTNNAGLAWSPVRAAIAIGHNGSRNTIRNTEVYFAAGAVGSGLTSLVTANSMTGVVLDNIRIIKPVGQGGLGFVLDKLPDVKMSDCHIVGATTAVTTFGAQDIWIKDFSAYDTIGTVFNLSGGVDGTHARIDGGRVERAVRAVNATNLTTLTVRRLQTKGITGNHIEQFGTTGAITIEGCHDEDGIGKLAGITLPIPITKVFNVDNNPGYVYTMRYALACITDKTSALNTVGKHSGRVVIADDGFVYISAGSANTTPWAKGSTLITPA